MKIAVIIEQPNKPVETFLVHDKESWSTPRTDTARRREGKRLIGLGYCFESACYRGDIAIEVWSKVESGDGLPVMR